MSSATFYSMECPYAFRLAFFPFVLSPAFLLFLEQASLTPHLPDKANVLGVSVALYCICWLHIPPVLLVPLLNLSLIKTLHCWNLLNYLSSSIKFEKPGLCRAPHSRSVVGACEMSAGCFFIITQCWRLWSNLLRVKAIRSRAGTFLFFLVYTFAAKTVSTSLLLTSVKPVRAEGNELQWTMWVW